MQTASPFFEGVDALPSDAAASAASAAACALAAAMTSSTCTTIDCGVTAQVCQHESAHQCSMQRPKSGWISRRNG